MTKAVIEVVRVVQQRHARTVRREPAGRRGAAWELAVNRSRNGALDVGGSFTVDDAVLVAAGSAGMAMAPDESGSRPTLSIRFGSTLPTGTLVEIADGAGTVVATSTSAKSFESLVVSTPDLAAGATYTVSVDGEAVGTVTA